MAKIASRKSKTVVVVFFGSPDLFDMLSDLDYKAMQTRLAEIKDPEDIKSLPSIIAGNKLVKIKAETRVIVEGESWGFFPVQSSVRSRKDIENDKYVARAIEQLASFLETAKPRFVLVPYYAKVEKKS